LIISLLFNDQLFLTFGLWLFVTIFSDLSQQEYEKLSAAKNKPIAAKNSLFFAVRIFFAENKTYIQPTFSTAAENKMCIVDSTISKWLRRMRIKHLLFPLPTRFLCVNALWSQD
jgi:hypothetical protein